MDESVRTSSRTGDVSELYKLIQSDGNVLRRFNEVEFMETPLHVAADEGCIRFAMEMMKLKPSFARKLNQQGLSPIHLALEKGHNEMVLRFLQMDKDLVRVTGKNGETPLHYICKAGNHDSLLETFLKACPDCIRDVTTENRSALHIAAENKRLDVLQILIRMLKKKDYYREEVNRKDEDGNTALHIAARNNQTQMLKLLLSCKADKHATNQAGLTALAVAEQHNNRESIRILRGCFIEEVSNIKSEWEIQIAKYVAKASSIIFEDLDNISSDDRNALLVVLGLLLTGTYQATLSPPGGVWQGDNTEWSKKSYDQKALGKSVLHQANFLIFYIPTYVVFMVTFFLTLALLQPFPHGFKKTIQVILAFFAVCFDQSISYMVPTEFAYKVIELFSLLLFVLTLVMHFTDRVSKPSVAILECWLTPSNLFDFVKRIPPDSDTKLLRLAIDGCWLFFFVKDDFWEGTIIVIGYCSFYIMATVSWEAPPSMVACPLLVLGCWFLLYLCRFCFKVCCQLCST
ncbi:ankyrin repeat-containing protein BDA1-like isoform X1 [Gossypium arboreum]|uniref:ankyrin repeat-containing protein BDA1-like isoform X1 n=1 Tax=Gossypium arboreum TaxID=29729 RepID=UPI00081938D2|nr:ankyrin repeat-containing protein BDA1-like isoform X1 [Gossypium arboreum]